MPNNPISLSTLSNLDLHSHERKADHINMALAAQVSANDARFYYEPILSAHPNQPLATFDIFGRHMKAPIWISSMTGGTEMAGAINKKLALTCGKYGLGMGLGSCRMLLHSDEHLADFQLRKYLSDDYPLFANLGIAQLEEIASRHQWQSVKDLIQKTEADGLIIHVNPMQEWLQPEGDRITESPLSTIQRCLEHLDTRIIVKEVGQGMGPRSLEALLKLPLSAIDFAAFGGTNFAKMEMDRNHENTPKSYEGLSKVGHSIDEMIQFYNAIESKSEDKTIILSGGIHDFLDGYYAMEKINATAIYGQASAFLKRAMISQEVLDDYVENEIKGLAMAKQYLVVR
jgi:isopentenyl-diphosphate delta-isomerase